MVKVEYCWGKNDWITETNGRKYNRFYIHEHKYNEESNSYLYDIQWRITNYSIKNIKSLTIYFNVYSIKNEECVKVSIYRDFTDIDNIINGIKQYDSTKYYDYSSFKLKHKIKYSEIHSIEVTYIDNTTETFYTNYIPTETEEKKVKKHKNFTCILIFILLMFMGVGIIFLLKYIGSLVTDYILLPIFYYLP